MKKICCTILSLLLVISSFCVFETRTEAADLTSADGTYKYTFADDSEECIRLTRYLGKDEIVTVPTVLDGKSVTEIGNSCFYMNEYIKEIRFPETITKIFSNAFYACVACEKYTVDENNPNYSSLDGVIYDKSKTVLLACPENYPVETFVVKDDVVEIGTNAFFYHQIYYPKVIYTHPVIKHIVLPEGLKIIRSSAFSGSEIKEFILPDSLTDEGGNFLAGAESYEKLHLGANIGTKYASGFNNYYLKEITISPENDSFCVEHNLLLSKDKTTLYCYPAGRSDTTFRVPDSVRTLAPYSLDASKLKNIDFNQTEIISSQTLGQDTSIKNLVFPKSVKKAHTIANFFQPGTYSITILNPDCEFSFPFNFMSGSVKYNVTIYGFNGSTAEEYVKNNTLSNLTLTFSALHTSDTEYNIYSGVHDYQGTVIEPTCTEQGYTQYKCNICGIEYKDNYVPALNHNYLPSAIIPAKCEEQGYTIYKCSRCPSTTHGNYTNPTGHNMTVVEKEDANCTSNGYVKYRCLLCNETKTEIIETKGHQYSFKEKINPTCTKSGYTSYVCDECSEIYNTDFIEPLGHNYYTTVTPATFVNNGEQSVRCSRCKKLKSVKQINKIQSVKLNKTSFVYTGKNFASPSITAKDVSNLNIGKSNYSVKLYSRSNNKAVSSPKEIGQYKAVVSFKNYYSGDKTLYFYVKPKAPVISNVKGSKGKINLKLKKDSSINYYRIVISENKSFTKNAKTFNVKSSQLSKSITGLKKNKKYYIKVCSYKNVKVDGKTTKMFSNYSKIKAVKTK